MLWQVYFTNSIHWIFTWHVNRSISFDKLIEYSLSVWHQMDDTSFFLLACCSSLDRNSIFLSSSFISLFFFFFIIKKKFFLFISELEFRVCVKMILFATLFFSLSNNFFLSFIPLDVCVRCCDKSRSKNVFTIEINEWDTRMDIMDVCWGSNEWTL